MSTIPSLALIPSGVKRQKYIVYYPQMEVEILTLQEVEMLQD
jgi:hypothetical protein